MEFVQIRQASAGSFRRNGTGEPGIFTPAFSLPALYISVGLLLICCAASCSGPLAAKRDLSGETISLGVHIGDTLDRQALGGKLREAGRTPLRARTFAGGGIIFQLGDGSVSAILYPFSDDADHVGTIVISGSLLGKAALMGKKREEALSELREIREGRDEEETLAEEARKIGQSNPQIATVKGIRLGSSTDDVIAAYGKPDLQGERESGTYFYYEGKDRTLAFQLVLDTVIRLMLLNPEGEMPPMESMFPGM